MQNRHSRLPVHTGEDNFALRMQQSTEAMLVRNMGSRERTSDGVCLILIQLDSSAVYDILCPAILFDHLKHILISFGTNYSGFSSQQQIMS